MKICDIANFWNVTNWTFLESYKSTIFKIFKNEIFLKFPNWFFFEFANYKLCSFPNWKFFEFSKFEVFSIVQIVKLRNFDIFFNLENQSLASKLVNFGIVSPFNIPHYSQSCQSSYLPFDINQFRRLIFSTFISYPSQNFLDWQIHKIIKSLKLFNFEN